MDEPMMLLVLLIVATVSVVAGVANAIWQFVVNGEGGFESFLMGFLTIPFLMVGLCLVVAITIAWLAVSGVL